MPTSPPRLSFTSAEWMRDTSRNMQIRSTSLKGLDYWVDTYIKTPSPNNLRFLTTAFQSWKDTKGTGDDWKDSGRNSNLYAFTRLDAELKGQGDTDAVFGVEKFLSEDMAHARLGLLYLFSNLRCKDNYFSITTNGLLDLTGTSLEYASGAVENEELKKASTLFGAVKDTAKEQASKYGEKVDEWFRSRKEKQRVVRSDQLLEARPSTPGNAQTRELRQQVSSGLEKAAKQVSQSIALDTKLNDKPESGFADKAWDTAPGYLRSLCDYLADKYLAQAAPFIGGGLATASGLVKAIDVGMTRYAEYHHANRSDVLSGYPSTIVNEIRRSMDRTIAAGLYKALKGGAQLTVEGVTAGAASPIASLVFSLVETIVNATWRMYDLHRMHRFFDEAKTQYVMRDHADALHHHPIAFNRWFSSYAVGTPVLSVIALTSGICGDKMRLLKMYTTKDNIDEEVRFKRASAAFIAGASYLDDMKVWGTKYRKEVGYEFTSDDPLVLGVIGLEHKPVEGFAHKRIWGSIKSFVG